MIQNIGKGTKTAEFKNLFLRLDEKGQESIINLLQSLISIQSIATEQQKNGNETECA